MCGRSGARRHGGTVGQQETVRDHRKFGSYLRKVREERKLSLDAVEEMSVGFPGRVTKSHLSRIENGQAVPTFPRMFALSQIYGVPISSLAERFEIDLRRAMLPPDVSSKSVEQLLAETTAMVECGRYAEALTLCEVLLDGQRELEDFGDRRVISIQIERVNCLIHLARYVSAKDECEDLLSDTSLESDARVRLLQLFAMCCYRLGKFTFALMAIEKAETELSDLQTADELAAYLMTLKANLFGVTGRPDQAVDAYQDAIRRFETLSNPFEACIASVNLASALIETSDLARATSQLRKAIPQAQAHGYDRQLALALSNMALIAVPCSKEVERPKTMSTSSWKK